MTKERAEDVDWTVRLTRDPSSTECIEVFRIHWPEWIERAIYTNAQRGLRGEPMIFGAPAPKQPR